MSPPRGAAEPGLQVVHRRYVPHSAAHYGGGIVDGAYALALFGDAVTELCIRSDGDEGLLAAYDGVRFHAPIRAGDVVEVTAVLIRVGRRSRGFECRAEVVCRAEPPRGASAAAVLDPPLLAVSASGTVVIAAG